MGNEHFTIPASLLSRRARTAIARLDREHAEARTKLIGYANAQQLGFGPVGCWFVSVGAQALAGFRDVRDAVNAADELPLEYGRWSQQFTADYYDNSTSNETLSAQTLETAISA